MREVLFRGILKEKGMQKCWIEGSLVHITRTYKGEEDEQNCDIYQIINNDGVGFYVDKDTIGQYTGLKDKNGKEIYEGDIVEVSEEGRMLFGSREHLTRKYSLIGFHDGAFMLGRNEIDFSRMDTYLCVMKNYISVVGNIYENKNLLEKENKDESSK